MFEYFKKIKPLISDEINEFLSLKSEEFNNINFIGKDLCNRLYDFTIKGKMIRAGLVSLAYSFFDGNSTNKNAIKAGAAMEILQSGLLIHDDIMDRDEVRRGSFSIYKQYGIFAEKNNLKDPQHIGEAMGICSGDISFFMAMEILGKLDLPAETVLNISNFCSKEISYVGIAQMMDLFLGASGNLTSEREILKLYIYKTGRYTFSLPLVTGCMIAGAQQDIINKMIKIGENIGIIFQIKDDELGLFGDEKLIGKPVGSDIKEGKKTLLLYYLLKNVNGNNNKKIMSIIGKADIGQNEIDFIRKLVIDFKIVEIVENKINELAEQSYDLIDSMKFIEKDKRDTLIELIDYNLNRNI